LLSLYNTWVGCFDQLHIPYRFIFVNDGSSDGSLQLLEELADANENINIYSHANQGHGPSIIRGYKAAADAEWILQMDADNPYDTDAFKMMWEQKEQYDFLVGSRYNNSAHFSRRLISLASVITVAILCGKFFKDVNTPYRLMRARDVGRALRLIPENSFAPNIMLTMFYIKHRHKIFTTALRYKANMIVKKSRMNSYFAGGALQSFFQLLQFRFRI